MIHVKRVADYFLSLVKEEEGDLMTNLKLQKLLYYAQGFHLATFGKPLFDKKIEAWIYGPVVPYMFKKYESYGKGAIPYKHNGGFDDIDDETKALLDEVYTVYGQFSASALKDIVKMDPPYFNTPIRGVIEHDVMTEYFQTRINDVV